MSNVTLENHEEMALARRSMQYVDKPQLEGLLRIFGRHMQEVEDVLFGMLTNRFVEDSVGQQVDELARIVGQQRGALLDDDLKLYIRARILANKSSGTQPELSAIFRLILPFGAGFGWGDEYPAAQRCVIRGVAVPIALAKIVAIFFRIAKTGGVGSWVEHSVLDPPDTFTLDPGVASQGLGDDGDPTAGGGLSNEIIV